MVFGIAWEPVCLRERILYRLDQRLKAGMIAEVSDLLAIGVSALRLDQLGLEYRYCLKYLSGELSLEDMDALAGGTGVDVVLITDQTLTATNTD